MTKLSTVNKVSLNYLYAADMVDRMSGLRVVIIGSYLRGDLGRKPAYPGHCRTLEESKK